MRNIWIKVPVRLGDGLHTVLRFRRDVYDHHVADATASGMRLDRYLAQKIWASGLAEVIADANPGRPNRSTQGRYHSEN